MLVDHENLGIDTNLNLLAVISTEIWAKIEFYVMAAINRCGDISWAPKTLYFFYVMKMSLCKTTKVK